MLRSERVGRGRRVPVALGAALGAVAAVLAWAAAPGGALLAQRADPVGPPPPAGDTTEAVARSGAVSPDSADALRAALEQPPGEYGFDLFDGLSIPGRLVFSPVLAFGYATRAIMSLLFRPGAPGPIQVALMDAAAWGVAPTVGSLGPRSGVAGGLLVTRWDPLFVRGAVSLRGSQQHAVGVAFGDSASSGRELEAAASFHRDAEPHFWGLGPDSREEDRTDFRWDRFAVGVSGTPVRPLAGRLPVRLHAGYEENWVRRGFDGDVPDLQDVADPDTLFGLDRRTRYARLGMETVLDLRRTRNLHPRGFLATGGLTGFLGLDAESRFLRWDGTATGYLPLNARQQLVLRGEVQGHAPTGGRGVPFTHLAELGGSQGLRGYRRLRFRDRDAVLFISEWRYDVWQDKLGFGRTEGFLFLDVGAVGERLTAIEGSDFRSSWGFGMRALSDRGPVLAWHLGLGGEDGARFRVSGSWAY